MRRRAIRGVRGPLRRHLTRITPEHDTTALTVRRIRAGEIAIRTRIARPTRKERGANWKDFAKLLRHLPDWAVNAHSPTAIVPRAGLFDLVIIGPVDHVR